MPKSKASKSGKSPTLVILVLICAIVISLLGLDKSSEPIWPASTAALSFFALIAFYYHYHYK